MNPEVEKKKTEFGHEEDNWAKVKNCAVRLNGLFEENKELLRIAPKIYGFITNLATENTDVRSLFATVNPAYAAGLVYIAGVLAISYQYSVEAQQGLQKAHFKKDDLQIIIDTEILPIIGLLEKLHSKKDVRRFRQAKTEIDNLIDNALTSLQTFRKDIEQQMIDSTSDAEKNQVLQWLSAAVGAVGSTVAVATIPCLAAGLLACLSLLSASILGVYKFRNNKLTHKQKLDLLNDSRIKALNSERALRQAIVNTEIMCIENASFPEHELDSLAIYMPKELGSQLNSLPDSSDL